MPDGKHLTASAMWSWPESVNSRRAYPTMPECEFWTMKLPQHKITSLEIETISSDGCSGSSRQVRSPNEPPFPSINVAEDTAWQWVATGPLLERDAPFLPESVGSEPEQEPPMSAITPIAVPPRTTPTLDTTDPKTDESAIQVRVPDWKPVHPITITRHPHQDGAYRARLCRTSRLVAGRFSAGCCYAGGGLPAHNGHLGGGAVHPDAWRCH